MKKLQVEGWKVEKLGDVCEKITDGSHAPPKGVAQSNYLMLSSKNVYDDFITYDDPRYLTEEQFQSENNRTKISEGDVLMTIVGTIGRVAVVPSRHPKFTLLKKRCCFEV